MKSLTFEAITTFSLARQPFGVDMIRSFIEHWPAEIALNAIVEGSSSITVTKHKSRLKVAEFSECCSFHATFKEHFKKVQGWRFKGQESVPFLFDAVRFAHKVFAIDHAIRSSSADVLIWLDADVVTHAGIPLDLLSLDLDPESGWSFLGRSHLSDVAGGLDYPECGFMMFYPKARGFQRFWQLMRYFYFEFGLYGLFEWHDSFVFQQALALTRTDFPEFGFDISGLGLVDVGDPSHVFIASKLGEFMDHKKGARKDSKFSKEFIRRQELLPD